jgi:hypothetical protein
MPHGSKKEDFYVLQINNIFLKIKGQMPGKIVGLKLDNILF